MPKPLCIIKNVPHEGPGAFEQVLREDRVPYQIVDLEAGEKWPDLSTIEGLMVMGGPDSANDAKEKMETELAMIRKALDQHLPYLGICLGLQTLVKAAGGSVRKNEVREIGCTDQDGKPFMVELTEEGDHDPLLKGLSQSTPIFHLHGETVDVTPSMTVLATGKWCRNQIVRVTAMAYGIQGHWDVTDEVLVTWKKKDADLQGVNIQKLDAEWKAMREQSLATAGVVFRNFLRIAGLLQ